MQQQGMKRGSSNTKTEKDKKSRERNVQCHTRNSEDPPKSCQTQPECENC
jgi:hypothetical protein